MGSTTSGTSGRASGGPSAGPGDDVATVIATWVLLPLAALAGLASVGVWLAGQLSGVLAGRGWPDVPVADAFDITARLAQEPDVPVRAWPPGVRARSAPGWLIYSLLALLLAALVAASILVARAKLRRDAHRRPDDGARWATRTEERSLAVADDPATRPGRLVAGRGLQTGRLLAAEDCISAVGFGPNGSGKTTGLIAPNVLEWAGPVVMTTTKPTDLALIHRQRAARGPVWVAPPPATPASTPSAGPRSTTPATPKPPTGWPSGSSRPPGCLPTPRPDRGWQARKYVKPLLLAAHLTGGGIDAFVRWVYAGQDAADDIRNILTSAGEHETWREYHSTWTIHAEGIGSVLFTAYGLADAYSRPSVRAAAAQGGFSPQFLFDQAPGTLVIVAAESDVDRYAPVITALIAAVVHEAEHRAARLRGPLTPRLLLAVDEAGTVFRYPRVSSLLTTARGNGIQLLLVYHDRAQIEQLFGARVARTVLSNAKLRILLPGQGDLDTLRWFSAILGQARVARSQVTRGAGGHRSTSTGEHAEDLAPVHTLRGLPEDVAVVQYRNLPGLRVRLRFCYRDKQLRRTAHAADASGAA